MSTLIKTTHKLTVFSSLALVLIAASSAFTSSLPQAAPAVVDEQVFTLHEVDHRESEVEEAPKPKSPKSKSKSKAVEVISSSSAPTTITPSTSVPAQPTAVTDGVSTSLAFVNGVRKSAGKSALSLDSVLNASALSHAKNLANQCKLYHQNISVLLGKKDARGKTITAVAENVAYSSSSLTQALNGLKNSSGHYKNMIGPYNRVGFGVVKSTNTKCKGYIYTVQVFAKS